MYYAEGVPSSMDKFDCFMCKQSFCVKCKVSWHNDFTCTDFQNLPEDMRGEDDRKSLLFMEKTYQRCARCKIFVEKNEGCDHITCRHCQNHFCYICGFSAANGGAVHTHLLTH
jgi:E3 ubiquitin-protein ligase RNF144